MKVVTRLGALALAVALTVAVVALSRVPLDDAGADAALLRLSWQMRGDVVETCRELSAEELERLPVHMRNPEACEGRARTYRLAVEVDGRSRIRKRIEPGGVRGDRPMTVLEELNVEPGRRAVRVEFAPMDAEASTEPWVLQDSLHLSAGQVVLITLGDGEAGLVVREPGR